MVDYLSAARQFHRDGELAVRHRVDTGGYNEEWRAVALKWLSEQALKRDEEEKASQHERAKLDRRTVSAGERSAAAAETAAEEAKGANTLAEESNEIARAANALAISANEIAAAANAFATRANSRARDANRIAIAALTVAALTAILAMALHS